MTCTAPKSATPTTWTGHASTQSLHRLFRGQHFINLSESARKEEGEEEEEEEGGLKKPAPARPYGGGIGRIGGCRATRASERGDPAAAAAAARLARERVLSWRGQQHQLGQGTDATKPAVVALVCGIMRRRSPLVKDEH